MIFHTIYSITIGEFAELQSTKNLNYIKRWNIWLPKSWINKAYKRLMTKYNEIGNNKEVNKLIRKDLDKLGLLSKITIQYPILIKLLDLYAKYGQNGVKSELKTVYKSIYGREPKIKFDYDRIKKDFKILIEKYKQRNIKIDEKQPIDFEQIIVNLELILAPVDLRNKKLYTLPKYIDMASQKVKQNDKK